MFHRHKSSLRRVKRCKVKCPSCLIFFLIFNRNKEDMKWVMCFETPYSTKENLAASAVVQISSCSRFHFIFSQVLDVSALFCEIITNGGRWAIDKQTANGEVKEKKQSRKEPNSTQLQVFGHYSLFFCSI